MQIMITRSNVVHAVSLCAIMCLSSGCVSQQQLAIKDRDIRDLRRQNAGRQEALVKALKTLESVRAELGASRYERRDLEQNAARSSASVLILQQNINRLEAQKTKLQEQLRQSEIAYERLMHTNLEMKAVLSNTVTDLAQTRRNRVEMPEGLESTEQEHTILRRKLDALRSQVLRERAARRRAELNTASPAREPLREENSPKFWRLTGEKPEVATIEPDSLAVDERVVKTKAADSTSDTYRMLGTAFLWTLGAVVAIGLTILMFVVLIRGMSRRMRNSREDHEESSQIGDYTDERDEPLLEDEAYEREDVVKDDASWETGDEQAIELDRKTPVDGGEQAEESETRPTEAKRSSAPAKKDEPPTKSFVHSLDWMAENDQAPKPRQKYSQDTEAVQLSDPAGHEEPHDRGRSTEPETADPTPEPAKHPREEPHDRGRSTEPETADPTPEPAKHSREEPHDRGRSTEPETADLTPEPAKHSREEPLEIDDAGNSDTQMIERIDTDGLSATQVLSVLNATTTGRNAGADEGDSGADGLDGPRNQEFTDTSVLDASDVSRATTPSPEESLEEMPIDTQILPPLLDFEDDSDLDEALGNGIDTDDENEGEEVDSDSKLLAELEDLMGEKFEEHAAV